MAQESEVRLSIQEDSVRLEVEHLDAAVVTAVHAHPVPQLQLAAGVAGRGRRGELEVVVRPAVAAAGLGGLFLGNSHELLRAS